MNTYRTNAVAAGVLYIVGTVSGVLSMVFSSPVLGGPGYLARVAANPEALILGAFCILAMGLALAIVPVALYPVLRRYNRPLAIGYIVFRGALETVTYLGIVAGWLLLVTLAQEYAAGGALAGSDFQVLGTLISKAAEISANLTAVVFPIGAMMLYAVLYQAKLIPRWLSVWGMIAVGLTLASAGVPGLAGRPDAMPAVLTAANASTLVQEMVMAAWFIAKGFNLPASAARPGRTEASELLSAA
jgi:hypothetical protein